MKIFTLLSLAGILLFSSFSFQKKNPVSNEEVMIGIPNMDLNDLEVIKRKFLLFSGVTYKGYCEDQKVVALVVDRNIVTDNKSITDALLSIKPDFKVFYKEGSFDDLRTQCMDGEKLFTK